MKIFKTIIGVILIMAGIVLGIYVSVWVCIIGGIVDIVEVLKTTGIDRMKLSWAILKILFAGIFGTLIYYFLALTGALFLQD